MKKRKGAVLRGAVWLVLLAVLAVCGSTLRATSPPKADAPPLSRMLLSSGELLYDAEGIAEVDSAHITSRPEETPSVEETQQQEQQQKQQEQDQQQEQPPEETDSPGQAVTPDLVESSGLDGLLDIGESGGGSGGQKPSRQPSENPGQTEVGDPDRYFETSIIDGDMVDYQRYTFTIRHLKPELQVLGLSVALNGQEYSYKATSSSVLVTLQEGANTLVVQAYYGSDTGNITASQTYTVYYGRGGEVFIVAQRSDGVPLADIGTTSQGELLFTAYGIKDGERLRPSVRLNGKTLSGSGDSFQAALEFGSNTIEVSAGGRGDTVTETFVIQYRETGFRITNSFDGTVIDNDTHQPDNISQELPVYLDTETFRFRLYLNQDSGDEVIRLVKYDDVKLSPGGDGWYTVELNTRLPKYLTVHYTNTDGENLIYKWSVRFHRNPEATPVEKQPNISATLEVGNDIIPLEDGLTLKSPDVITIIDSRSWNSEQLYYNNYQVLVNGRDVYGPCSQTGSTFGYETYLTNEGANTITITATDADGYSVTRSWTVYYEKGDVTVTISVEATTVGLGYLIPPTEVTAPGGTDLMTMVVGLLEENGYTASVSSGTYLAAIGKPGICEGFYIDEELIELILADNMDATGAGYDPQPASMDSLGEFDFYRWSGWMFSYNGRYPGYSMASCKPQDGAEIRLRFTLALGKDIGGFTAEAGSYGASSGNYYREW